MRASARCKNASFAAYWLDMIVSDAIARAGAEGFTAKQVQDRLKDLLAEQKKRS